MEGRRSERDWLVGLFEGDGISATELSALLASRPGALTRMLTAEFIAAVGALRRGEFHEVAVRGFVISAPSHFESAFLVARPRLEALVGPCSLAVVSPGPTDMRFALPAVVPRDVATAKDLYQARFARIRGTLLSLDTFGGAPARFLLAHEVQVLGFEEFFSAGAPSLTGADVLELLQQRLNLDYSEVRTAMLVHLFSAPPYLDRAGGTGLSLLACEERGRCLTKRSLEGVLQDLRLALPPYMTGRRASATMDYLGIRPVPLRFAPPRLSWRFDTPEREAVGFLRTREAAQGFEEVSLSTRGVLEMHRFKRPLRELMQRPSEQQAMMSVCDLPLLLARDDLARDERALGLHEQSEDVAHAVAHAAARFPATVLDAGARGTLVEHILRDIHREWPDLERLMRQQVLFDLGARGGLIEHATRATGAVARALGRAPEDAAAMVQGMYVDIFARFYGELEGAVRHLSAVLEKRERQLAEQMDRDLLDALEGAFLHLDAGWPDGWAYPQFERLVKSRVRMNRAQLRRRFDLLRQEGEVVEVADGVFKRVWGLSRFG